MDRRQTGGRKKIGAKRKQIPVMINDDSNKTDLDLLGAETVFPECDEGRNTVFAVVDEDEHALGVEGSANVHIIVVIVFRDGLEGLDCVRFEFLDGGLGSGSVLCFLGLGLDMADEALDVVFAGS